MTDFSSSAQESIKAMEYLPSKLWGVDPLFRINVRLSIADILNMTKYPTASDQACMYIPLENTMALYDYN